MAFYIDVKGNLFPDAGTRLRHRALGVEGVYVMDVFVNRSKKHFKVVDDEGRTYILPSTDWELADDKARAV